MERLEPDAGQYIHEVIERLEPDTNIHEVTVKLEPGAGQYIHQ
jgi:hypothetical protein